MNIYQLKDKLRKIKTSVWYKNILDEILLTSLKEKAPIYTDGVGLTKNQQNKNYDTSINHFPNTEYWKPLVPNAKIVGKTTNPYFKNLCAPSIAENEAEFGLV